MRKKNFHVIELKNSAIYLFLLYFDYDQVFGFFTTILYYCSRAIFYMNFCSYLFFRRRMSISSRAASAAFKAGLAKCIQSRSFNQLPALVCASIWNRPLVLTFSLMMTSCESASRTAWSKFNLYLRAH